LEGEVIISADTAAATAVELGCTPAAEQLLYVSAAPGRIPRQVALGRPGNACRGGKISRAVWLGRGVSQRLQRRGRSGRRRG
jgi:hypothetical protein